MGDVCDAASSTGLVTLTGAAKAVVALDVPT